MIHLIAHFTFNEIAGVMGIYLMGLLSGLAVAWKFGGSWFHRD